jgi:HAD superfamily hydrolase (TIGR01459 family)
VIPLIGGLAEIADRYDGFIVDLWGVLHDGTSAFAGAADALRALKQRGKRVLLLSNAPRRAAPLAAQMAAMGLGAELYDHLLTSGEAVVRLLGEPDHSVPGRRYYLMGPAHDGGLVAGLDLDSVDLDDADFILNVGPWGDQTVEDFLPALSRAAARALPMICANPDLWVVRQGKMMPCAGLLADRYQEMGGPVLRRGKPDPAIYAEALALLGATPARTLCIGDSMVTDMAGAAAAGLDALLVTRGIHAEELGWPPQLEALARRYGLYPMAAIANFEV